MRSIIRGLIASAESDPEAARVMGGGGEVWTNRMLVHRMFSIATYLRRNVRAGSRVVLQTDSAGLFWSGFAGTCAAGCDVVPVSASAPYGVTDRIRVELTPAYWLGDRELRSIVGEASMIEAEDFGGAILLSSGTTGRSRFLRRSSEMLDRIAKVLVASGLHAARDHVIASLPLHHAYGLEHAFLAPALANGRVTHASSFDSREFLSCIRGGCNVLATVPPALRVLLDEGWPSETRGRVIVAGTPLSGSLRRRFETEVERWDLVDLYGATELGTIWLDHGSGGVPVDGVEVRLDGGDRGEILVRSRTRFDYYCDDPQARFTDTGMDEEDWFRTGDVGHRCTDVSFAVEGRCKLVFDVGGLKVNPFDVEAALDAHPAVQASLVGPIGAKDGVRRVRALVELRKRSGEACGLCSPHDLRTFLHDRVPPHAIPRMIEFVESLPRSASGKLLREFPDQGQVCGDHGAVLELGPRDEGSSQSTRAIFDAAADGYDWSSAAGFLWTDGWYRRRELNRCGLSLGDALLDVGGGSGRAAVIASSMVGPSGRVTLVDPSPGMRVLAARKGIQEIHEGIAEQLPVGDSEFDVVVMGYMLRHVHDLERGFQEALRALKPLGRICVLEITEPRGPLSKAAFRLFAFRVLPFLSWVGTRQAAVVPMMRLWAETMQRAPSDAQVVRALQRAGFVGIRRRCEFGIFTSYRGIKPASVSARADGILSAN